uniref:Uncharacterized protein n=1 Tax=Aplanochytrium stocchinoi TaxID=215587 RepID=A0A7S3LQR0_9STRA
MNGNVSSSGKKKYGCGAPASPFSIDPDMYENLLQLKVNNTLDLVLDFMTKPLQDECVRIQNSPQSTETVKTKFCIFRSPKRFFRLRIRLGVIRSSDGELKFAIWQKGGLTPFPTTPPSECYPIPARIICNIMPELINRVKHVDVLSQGLRACHFMTTLSEGEVLITLVYDRELLCSASKSGLVNISEHNFTDNVNHSSWVIEAKCIKEKFEATWPSVKFNLIGRCRGTALVIGSNFIVESLNLLDKSLKYRQVEGAFSNPNGHVNCKALEWLYSCAVEEIIYSKSKVSLLEMYCGNCNHTCALAPLFHNIVAVELNQKLCDAASFNLKLNGVTNVKVIQSDSEKVSKRIIKTYASQGRYIFQFKSVSNLWHSQFISRCVFAICY